MWSSVAEESGQCAVLWWSREGAHFIRKEAILIICLLTTIIFKCLRLWLSSSVTTIVFAFLRVSLARWFSFVVFLVKNFPFSNSAGQLFLQRAAWCRPAKLLCQRRTHFIPFFKEQRKAWISYYSIQDNSSFKQLQPQARTTLQGTSNFRRMGKICPKWSCLSEAESSGGVESPLSLVAQSRSSADYGLNGEHPFPAPVDSSPHLHNSGGRINIRLSAN